MSSVRLYRVMWKIDIYAESAEQAAQIAREIQSDPESTATVFEVYDRELDPAPGEEEIVRVDLSSE